LNDEAGNPYSSDVFYLFEKHRQGSTGEVRFKHNSTLTSFHDTGSSGGSTFLPVKHDMPELEPKAMQPNESFDISPF
jgi:hypothetical protein